MNKNIIKMFGLVALAFTLFSTPAHAEGEKYVDVKVPEKWGPYDSYWAQSVTQVQNKVTKLKKDWENDLNKCTDNAKQAAETDLANRKEKLEQDIDKIEKFTDPITKAIKEDPTGSSTAGMRLTPKTLKLSDGKTYKDKTYDWWMTKLKEIKSNVKKLKLNDKLYTEGCHTAKDQEAINSAYKDKLLALAAEGKKVGVYIPVVSKYDMVISVVVKQSVTDTEKYLTEQGALGTEEEMRSKQGLGDYIAPDGTQLLNEAVEESTKIQAATSYSGIVAGKGLFTKFKGKYVGTCDDSKIKDLNDHYKGSHLDPSSKKDVFPTDKDEDTPTKVIGGVAKGVNKKAGDGIFAANCDREITAMSLFVRMLSPLNLTNNEPVMKTIAISQYIAFAMSIVIVVFYGIMYMTGTMGIDPIKFFMRLFGATLAVYFLPYLMQDILNLNNIIVYNLSRISPGSGWGAGQGAVAAIIIGQAVSVIIGSLVASAGTSALVWVAIALGAIIMMIKPLMQIMIWWYSRLLMIFVLAIFGPILVVMIALPQTAKMATKWMNAFIAEVFSQTFLALAVFLCSSIFYNMKDFQDATGINFVGVIFLVYSMIMFIGEVPSLAKSLIGGGIGNPIERGMRDAMMAGFVGAASIVTNGGDYIGKKRNEGKAKEVTDQISEGQSNAIGGLSLQNPGGSMPLVGDNAMNGAAIEQGTKQMAAALGMLNGIKGEGVTAEGGMNPDASTSIIPKSGELEGTEEGANFEAQSQFGEGEDGQMNMDSLLGIESEEASANQTGAESSMAMANESHANTDPLADLRQSDDYRDLQNDMFSSLGRGELDEDAAHTQMAEFFAQAEGVSAEQASDAASAWLSEQENNSGISWDARNALGSLAASGDLNRDNAQEILHREFTANPSSYGGKGKENKNGDVVSYANLDSKGKQEMISSYMDKTGLSNHVGKMTAKETGQRHLENISRKSDIRVGDIHLKSGPRKDLSTFKPDSTNEVVRNFNPAIGREQRVQREQTRNNNFVQKQVEQTTQQNNRPNTEA